MSDYVIAYDGKKKSFFDKMTEIGPKFGANLTGATRFATMGEAINAIDSFPTVAALLCSVVPVASASATNRGMNAKRRRKALGMTQETLARSVGVTRGAISSYERGVQTVLRDELKQKVHDFLLAAEESGAAGIDTLYDAQNRPVAMPPKMLRPAARPAPVKRASIEDAIAEEVRLGVERVKRHLRERMSEHLG